MWSNQEVEQLVGRCWRYPQTKDVIFYRTCLATATDMFLTVLSFSKSSLMTTFAQSSENTSKCIIYVRTSQLTSDHVLLE